MGSKNTSNALRPLISEATLDALGAPGFRFIPGGSEAQKVEIVFRSTGEARSFLDALPSDVSRSVITKVTVDRAMASDEVISAASNNLEDRHEFSAANGMMIVRFRSLRDCESFLASLSPEVNPELAITVHISIESLTHASALRSARDVLEQYRLRVRPDRTRH